MSGISTLVTVTEELNKRIKKGILYNSSTGSKDAVVIDPETNGALGFEGSDQPYMPIGGSLAIDGDVKGVSNVTSQGFVLGSTLKSYPCRHLYGKTYCLDDNIV